MINGYLYLILQNRITEAKTSVTPLERMIGQLDCMIPNASQVATPKVKIEYMASEMEDVSFVFKICTACGKKENVVQAAATYPVNSLNSINAF